MRTNKNSMYDTYVVWRTYTDPKKSFIKKIAWEAYIYCIKKGILTPRIIKPFISLDKNISIIDLGCGNGTLLKLFSNSGFLDLTGVDILDPIDGVLPVGYKYVQKEISDYLMEKADASVSLLIMTDVLEHLSQSEAEEVLVQIYRVLCDGGQFLCRVPNMASPLGMQIGFGDLTHKLFFTKNSLLQLLVGKNFKSIEFIKEPLSMYPIWRPILRILFLPFNWIRNILMYSYGLRDVNLDPNILLIAKK